MLALMPCACSEEVGEPGVAAGVPVGEELPQQVNADAVVPVPDIALPDAGPPDLGDTDFGTPCESNDDCESGWCIESDAGQVCTKTCIDTCPEDWGCKGVANAGGDLTYICVPKYPRLCWPCSADSECQGTYAEPGARCVVADKGGFCGVDCAVSDFCPTGYLCTEVELPDGGTTSQCLPESGECACSPLAIALKLSTDCQNVSANGEAVCTGSRRCDEEGLTNCDAAFPALEVCDGKDNDCNGKVDGPDSSDCVTWYSDTDGDNYGIGVGECLCEEPGPGFGTESGDCNDLNANVNPGNPEICNFADDDCDGETDEDGSLGCSKYYPDADEDTFGSDAGVHCGCTAPEGVWITDGGDCNDNKADISPLAQELCDGIDNNCDGEVDEENALGCVVYYLDKDGDGFGQDVQFKCLCALTLEYNAENGGDCDDLNDDVHPLAAEVCNDIDDNCDGIADEHGTIGCGLLYKDEDEDGFGDPNDSKCFCAPQGPYTVTDMNDCNDLSAAALPGGDEICDGLDNDCDGVVDNAPPEADCIDWYVDADKDGFGFGEPKCMCSPDGDYKVQQGGDCDDANPTAFPGGQETCAPADENCNGTINEPGALGCVSFFKDEDNDTWGVGESQCVCQDDPVYNASKTGDCYDQNPQAKPGQGAWFKTHRGDGSFDYDCDGAVIRKWMQTGGGCGSWPGCDKTIAWSGGLPECGATAAWTYDCDSKLFKCKHEQESRTQECH